jgi:hypothetical protein
MRQLHQSDHFGNNWPTIMAPVLTLPGGLLNVALPILLTASPLQTDNGTVDTLVNTQFRVVNDAGLAVWSGAGLGAVSIPLLTLVVGQGYRVQARHIGAALGAGPWSDLVALAI